ncbi:MAG: antitoxin [Alphaproteobacteria bacterium]
MAKPDTDPEDTIVTAKLFMNGRSQAVRLPKAFRFEGEAVRIRRKGRQVILEPLETVPADVDAWFARMDALKAHDFLPDGRPDQPPMPEGFPNFDDDD